MNSRELGYLLLTSHLGDPRRRPLTVAQLRELERCILRSERPRQDKDLVPEDLIALGCGEETAARVVSLLDDLPLLQSYLEKGKAADCRPISRVSPEYPLRLRKCLNLDAPGCIWLKGNIDLLNRPAVSLVGSRDLCTESETFARTVGQMAAQFGFVLISGNARGADMIAQESCLRAGGSFISIVADSLMAKKPADRVLYISEEGFDLPFTNQRALSRNRLIHSMPCATFVAQCSNGSGGTWDGTCRNLRGQWSPVYCLADGSAGVAKLYKMGAHLITTGKLHQVMAGIAPRVGENAYDFAKNDKMVK